MRVTHVIRQYHPSVGGMEDMAHRLARLQRETLGVDARVVTLDRLLIDRSARLPAEETLDGVPIRRIPFRGSSRYPLAPSALGALGDPDVVHVHGIDFFFDFFAITKPWHGRALVASTHGGFFHTRFASTLKRAYFQTITRASCLAYDRLVATSDNDARLFSPIARADRLVTIENGVDAGKWRDRASRALVPVIVSFGRWSDNKRVPDLLRLFAQLRARDPSWRLIVAGRPYDKTERELATQAQALGLGGSVSFAANPGAEALGELLSQASYFASLSSHEGFGIAPIEAMGAGLTPVLSGIPAFRKVMDGSKHGILAEDGAESRTIDSLLALHRLGQSAYDERRRAVIEFASGFSWVTAAERYQEAYQAALGGKRRLA